MEAPIYSFGNRLEANIRNKEHLKPKKLMVLVQELTNFQVALK